jgi:hypothetical protein
VKTYAELFPTAVATILLIACGGNENAERIVVPRLTAEEAILQVSESYESTRESRRLLDPPSALAIHHRQERSRLTLSKSNPVERIVIVERFEYRNGRFVECRAEGLRPLRVSYRFENEHAMAKLVANRTPLGFRCSGEPPPELVPSVDASAIELVLRDESLQVVLPTTDQRRFLPVD